MLNKEFRLRKNGAFIATYKQGQVVSDEYFTLYGGRIKDPESEYSTRFGFVVSKKIHKRAVKRNRLKRLMRESCRLGIKNKEFEQYKNFTSLVFVAKEPALSLNLADVQKSIDRLLKRLTKKFVSV